MSSVPGAGISLVFARRFSMGHRLIGGGSEACALPHGHNEVVRVWLRPARELPLDGQGNMVEPFERAKGRWHRFVDEHLDHALQLGAADPLLAWFRATEPSRAARIVVLPGDPTTELMACCLLAKLSAFLRADGGRLVCAGLAIEETPTNCVQVGADVASLLPEGAAGWWQRPDMSVNEDVAQEEAGHG